MALSDNVLQRLRELVGAANVLTAKEDLIPYSFDGTAALKEQPGCVMFARTPQQISEILKLANAERLLEPADHEVAHAALLPALGLPDLDVRMELLLAVLDHDALAEARQLVELLAHRLVLDDVDEADRAFRVGDCTSLSEGRTKFEILIFWRNDERTEQRTIIAEAVNEKGTWLIDRVNY